MKRFSKRASLSTLAELNVTPLLDLAFVLLIIFMITTPLMEKSSDLVLPSSVAAEHAVKPSQLQTVAIDRNGALEWNGQPIAVGELSKKIAALKIPAAETGILIRSDKHLPVQKLIDVMDAIKSAGVTKVGVVTKPEQQ